MIDVNPWLIYSTATFTIGLGVRIWAARSSGIRKRREDTSPIAEPFALEVALAPRKATPDDDESVLDAMKGIIARVNRRSQSLEFGTVNRQLVKYYGGLPSGQRPTARRGIVRLIESGDAKLQEIGARAAATIGIPEAGEPLKRLMDSLPGSDGSEPGELLELLRTPAEPEY